MFSQANHYILIKGKKRQFHGPLTAIYVCFCCCFAYRVKISKNKLEDQCLFGVLEY